MAKDRVTLSALKPLLSDNPDRSKGELTFAEAVERFEILDDSAGPAPTPAPTRRSAPVESRSSSTASAKGRPPVVPAGGVGASAPLPVAEIDAPSVVGRLGQRIQRDFGNPLQTAGNLAYGAMSLAHRAMQRGENAIRNVPATMRDMVGLAESPELLGQMGVENVREVVAAPVSFAQGGVSGLGVGVPEAVLEHQLEKFAPEDRGLVRQVVLRNLEPLAPGMVTALRFIGAEGDAWVKQTTGKEQSLGQDTARMTGQIASLFVGGTAASVGVKQVAPKVPGLSWLYKTADAARVAALKGEKLTRQQRLAQVGAALVEGQIVGQLATAPEYFRKPEELEENIYKSVTLGLAFDALAISPIFRDVVGDAIQRIPGYQKLVESRAMQAFKGVFSWLGRTSDDTKEMVATYQAGLAADQQKIQELLEQVEAMGDGPGITAAREMLELRLRGAITANNGQGYVQVRGQIWKDFDDQIKSINADKSLTPAAKQVQISELRATRAEAMRSLEPDVAAADAAYMTARSMLDVEEDALRIRLKDEKIREAEKALENAKERYANRTKLDDEAKLAQRIDDAGAEVARLRKADPKDLSWFFHDKLTRAQLANITKQHREKMVEGVHRLGIDQEYLKVRAEMDRLGSVLETGTKRPIAEVVDELQRLERRRGKLEEIIRSAGLSPDRLYRDGKGILQRLERHREALIERRRATESAREGLHRDTRKVQSQLDRAKSPMSPRQTTVMREAQSALRQSANLATETANRLSRGVKQAVGRVESARKKAKRKATGSSARGLGWLKSERATALTERLRQLVIRQGKEGNDLLANASRELRRTDPERIAALQQELKGNAQTLRKWKHELTSIRKNIEAVDRTLEKLRKQKRFPGRGAMIRELLDAKATFEKSIQTHYSFGGTGYSPRMYYSKETGDTLGNLMVGVQGPKIDKSLRQRRDPFRVRERAEAQARRDIEIEKIRKELETATGEDAILLRNRWGQLEEEGVQGLAFETRQQVLAEQKLRDSLAAQLRRATTEAEKASLKKKLEQTDGRLVRLRSDLITDPTYPVGKRLEQLAQDRRAHELFTQLESRPEVLSVEKWEALASNPALSKWKQKDFVQLTGKSLGPLDGKYVLKDLAEELRGVAGIKDEATRWYQTLLSVWKLNKTALNPATHFRNITSNLFFLEFAGIPAAQQAAWYYDVIQSMKANDAFWKEFKSTGLLKANFLEEDLARLTGIRRDMKGQDLVAQIARQYTNAPVVKDLIRTYNMEDGLARAIAFKKARELGLDVKDATKYANRYIPNYDFIPNTAFTRRLGHWQPFYKFSWAATPIMARNLMEQPLRFAKWGAMAKALNDLSAGMLELPEDLEDDVRATLPTFMQHGAFAPSLLPMLPKKDQHGRMQFIDLSYYVPLNNMVAQPDTLLTEAAQMGLESIGLPKGLASVVPTQMVDPGNPALRAMVEILANKQLYNDMPIYRETDSVDEKVEKVADYLYSVSVPTIAGWGKKKIANAIRSQYLNERTDTYLGRDATLEQAIVDTIFGMKIRGKDPAEEKDWRMKEARNRITDLGWERKRRLDRGLPLGDIDQRIREANRELARLNALQVEQFRAPKPENTP